MRLVLLYCWLVQTPAAPLSIQLLVYGLGRRQSMGHLLGPISMWETQRSYLVFECILAQLQQLHTFGEWINAEELFFFSVSALYNSRLLIKNKIILREKKSITQYVLLKFGWQDNTFDTIKQQKHEIKFSFCKVY